MHPEETAAARHGGAAPHISEAAAADASATGSFAKAAACGLDHARFIQRGPSVSGSPLNTNVSMAIIVNNLAADKP